MRILIAGDWHSDLHEEEALRSLKRLGHEVGAFKWFDYFHRPENNISNVAALLRRTQNKFVAGPLISRINRDLVQKVVTFAPDVLFVYRGTHITADALRSVKEALPGCTLVGYNNDDPFAPNQPRSLWRHFLASVPVYDLMLAYRHTNLEAFRRAGARRVELLRSWFVPGRNFPLALTVEEKNLFASDVVFVGHYEPDQRVEFLEEIVRQGFRLRLFGPTRYWEKPLARSEILRSFAPIQTVWGADYNRALCGAKVALCFFSKLNRDTYTRRCFEIPATRTLMLSEYSDDLASLYREGVEADFFRNKDEMIAKLRYYINDEVARNNVADNGFRKVISAGHDIDSRMHSMMHWVANVRNNAA